MVTSAHMQSLTHTYTRMELPKVVIWTTHKSLRQYIIVTVFVKLISVYKIKAKLI